MGRYEFNFNVCLRPKWRRATRRRGRIAFQMQSPTVSLTPPPFTDEPPGRKPDPRQQIPRPKLQSILCNEPERWAGHVGDPVSHLWRGPRVGSS